MFSKTLRADDAVVGRFAFLTEARAKGVRVALTKDGAVFLVVEDRFTEQILDLHWSACLAAVLSIRDGQLGEFAGIAIEGHLLAASLDELIAGCLRVASE